MVVDESAKDDDDSRKWRCPRCGSWCLTDDEGEVYMAAWLLEGREWPR
jgi:hypothetical protein